MSKFAERYQTDKGLQETGAWVDLGDGIKIKVRRTNGKKSRQVLRRLNKPHDHLRQRNRPIPQDIQDGITRQWLSQGVLLDWEGVTDAAGKAVAFSAENVEQVLEAFPDFSDDVAFYASEAETFRAEDAAVGNSRKRSTGN